eukprot:CAMPEP_0173388076 /NCGR_PEP_ID=MMETSP1356-20130122/10469_1 /TAXON_ID=77927 ORGANISM="Hemiselmis virescens, Strain PCC157" /NCGR_SAMPLE_ID=MMETSP1356 /ASSEMBLY_ACC=CAM_ASM_000847 /LENGTH=69 /DNA_ID=CAMNT_0014344889 /DNA_START=287 /DNA_END=493 /DNA_ORIENTATION=-
MYDEMKEAIELNYNLSTSPSYLSPMHGMWENGVRALASSPPFVSLFSPAPGQQFVVGQRVAGGTTPKRE